MECRKLARDLVQGKPHQKAFKHMEFNYEYYASRAAWSFPDKEIFVLRTEHEHNDTLALDRYLGGTGRSFQQERRESYGSANYAKAPVSQDAYHKLCCVLEKDLDIYLDILDRAVNLSEEQKEATVVSLQKKCGIISGEEGKSSRQAWTMWKTQCRSQLEYDQELLSKYLQ